MTDTANDAGMPAPVDIEMYISSFWLIIGALACLSFLSLYLFLILLLRTRPSLLAVCIRAQQSQPSGVYLPYASPGEDAKRDVAVSSLTHDRMDRVFPQCAMVFLRIYQASINEASSHKNDNPRQIFRRRIGYHAETSVAALFVKPDETEQNAASERLMDTWRIT
jgi:hypothetical protein